MPLPVDKFMRLNLRRRIAAELAMSRTNTDDLTQLGGDAPAEVEAHELVYWQGHAVSPLVRGR